MKHWIIGIVLAVVALGLLYGAAVTSQTAATASLVMLLGTILAVIGIFVVITHASKHMTPLVRSAAPATASAGTAPEVDTGPAPWAGTGATLGVTGVGVAGLLVYLGIYIGGWAGVAGWLIYIAVAMTFAMLVVLVMLTAGKTE